ncbi:MAG: hypothetical protein AAF213_08775 [Pseudomonadota bacterium]
MPNIPGIIVRDNKTGNRELMLGGAGSYADKVQPKNTLDATVGVRRDTSGPSRGPGF